MAKSRWATAMARVLRPVSIIIGATFAVHRLTVRLADERDGAAGAIDDRSYPSRLADALTPDSTVVEAIGRTALLAISAVVIGIAVGWLAMVVRRRIDRFGARADRPVSGLWTGLLLALVVPGLTWLPLQRWAVDQGVVPDGPLGSLRSNPEGYRSIGLWSVLTGLAVAPTVAAALSGGRSWTSVGAAGHPGLAPLAARPSSEPVWRFGIPALTFGVTLALAEVVSGSGGLVDRFVAALGDGRPDDVLDLATPVIIGSALLAPLADLGAAVLRRVERPEVPGSARVLPARPATVASLGLAALVLAAAVAGGLTGPETDPVDRALAGPSFGGPWLGTDGMGRSLADRTAAALGATLVASAIPAAVATLVGAGLAFFRRSQRATVGAVFNGLLDLLSWPPALVVPLAAWPPATSGRSLLHPVVLQITGLLLVPAATRLLIRPAVRWSPRIARLAATMCVLTAAALAVQLLAGLVVPDDGSGWPGLGQLVATGLTGYEASPWPVLIPLLAAAAAGTALFWLADALTRIDHEAVLATGDPDDVPAVLEPVPVGVTLADDSEPVIAQWGQAFGVVEDDAGGPSDVEQPILEPIGIEPDPTEPIDVEPDPTEPELVDGDVDEDLDEDSDEMVDIRDDISIASAVDVPPPSESVSIEDEAGRTVELRPSDLRRAGLHPDEP